MYVQPKRIDWDEFLPSILVAFRTSPSATTGDSPFNLLYGREPKLTIDTALLPPSNLSASIEEHRKRIVTQLEEAQRLAKLNTERVQQNRKARYDQTAANPKFEIGQRVWVFTPKTKKGLSRKLFHNWHGPFRIVKKLSPVNFQLKNAANRLVSTPVHVNRLKPFYDQNDRPIQPPIEDPEQADSLSEVDLPAMEAQEAHVAKTYYCFSKEFSCFAKDC